MVGASLLTSWFCCPAPRSSVPPCWKLVTRILTSLPTELHDPDLVTPAVLDTLASVAQDELLCALMPDGTRPALLRLLARARPDVQQVLGAAEEAEVAARYAKALVQEVRDSCLPLHSPAPSLTCLFRMSVQL